MPALSFPHTVLSGRCVASATAAGPENESPMMALPALIDGDGPILFESLAIIEYLDETHPNPPLLPRDARGRARVRGV
jgi:glutathione S-transferase